ETLFRADQPELVIRGASIRRVAQNLVAQCDSVIEEAALGVEINSFFVIADCLLAVAEAEVKIADAVIQRHIALFVARPRKIEHLLIQLEYLVVLLLVLEFGGFLLEFCDIGHQSLKKTIAVFELIADSGLTADFGRIVVSSYRFTRERDKLF